MFVLIVTAVFFIIVAVVWNLIGLIKHLIVRARFRRHARLCIGDEVSIHQDKGAKLAYNGIYCYFCGDYSKAIRFFERAIALSVMPQNNAFCLDWLAQCYEAQEKPRDSLSCCIKAVDVEPSNTKSLFNLADMYARNGVFSKAEFYYNRVLRYDSGNIAANFMLGTLHMGRGLYDEAEIQFRKTLDLDEKFAGALAEMSVIMAIKGNYNEMNSYYEKAQGVAEVESERLKRRLDSIKRMRKLCEA
jgi:tetratricopeptide (TPR) repeat protein